MADAPLSASDFNNSATQNPNGPQLSAADFTDAPAPQSGAAHDSWWSSTVNAGARILNSMGVGAQQQWGAEPVGLNPDEEASLRKAGIFNDYVAGHTSLMKSFNEAIIRPAADIASLATRGIPAAFAGVGSGLEQTAREVGGQQTPQALPGSLREAAAYPLAAAGELAQGVSTGFGGEFPAEAGAFHNIAGAEHANVAAAARSIGVVGEGEAGFYDAVPPTPEALTARVDAAKEAGIEAVPPAPPPPDIHALARRIDPGTFEQFDALAADRQAQVDELARLRTEREASPEVSAAKAQIDDLLGVERGTAREGDFASRLGAFAASAPEPELARLDAAMDQYERAMTADTPEMAAARDRQYEAESKMRDLLEPMSAARRAAQEMAPQLPETTAEGGEAAAAAGAAPEVPGEPEAPPQIVPAVAAGEGAEAQVEPPSVTGDQKLGAGTTAQEGAEPKPRTSSVLKGIQGSTDETGVRRVAERSEENAIATGLAETTGDLPTYGVLKDADQAAIVTDLMDKDYERSKAIAMGTREPPKGATPEAFFIGVENRAMAAGDFDTVYALKDSKLAKAGTTMGQRISTYRTRSASSPVAAMQDIESARERAVGAPAITKTVADMEAEVRKASADRDAAEAAQHEADAAQAPTKVAGAARKVTAKPPPWKSFIDSITCGE